MTSGSLSTVVTSYVVVRTPVAAKSKYGDYREDLRIDFWFTCAYCTISEAEARGIGFEIDHYEPVDSRPELAAVYANLMYACEHCNSRKWKICPPPAARAKGLRFFKADEDNAPDHFTLTSDDTLRANSAVGNFTITMLDLNRSTLVRLRAIRRRIAEAADEVAFGLRALKGLPIDRLSRDQKVRFGLAAHEMESENRRIDGVLMKLCRSELLDADDTKRDRSRQRREHLTAWRVQHPDPWWSERNEKKAKD